MLRSSLLNSPLDCSQDGTSLTQFIWADLLALLGDRDLLDLAAVLSMIHSEAKVALLRQVNAAVLEG